MGMGTGTGIGIGTGTGTVTALPSPHGCHRAAGTPTHLGATQAQVPHVPLLSPGSSDAVPAGLALWEAHSVVWDPSLPPGSGAVASGHGSSPALPAPPAHPLLPGEHKVRAQAMGTVPPVLPVSPPVGSQWVPSPFLTFCPPGPRAPGNPVEPFSPCSPLAPCKQKRGARGRRRARVPPALRVPMSPPTPYLLSGRALLAFVPLVPF